MKILVISFSLKSGGAERMVVDLCNRYAMESENEVWLLTLLDIKIPRYSHYLYDLSDKVQHINTGENRGYSFKNIWQVYNVIKQFKPDIVHDHCEIMVLLLPALLYKKTIYIHTIHNLVYRYAPNYIIKKISKWLYAKRKVIPVTISDTCHKSYVSFYNLTNDVCVINGREALHTTVAFKDVKTQIENLKMNEDTPVFIHVARHSPVKNHKRLFSTFRRLDKEGVDFLLLVIGEKYEDIIDETKKYRRIVFLGEKNNVGDYMALSDYFVLSSDVEGLPLSLLEAMSMGVVPICTPAGGIKDVIKNGVNGYISDKIDDEDFYKSVCQALKERNKISKGDIIEDFNNNYSMDICSAKYMNLYQNELQKLKCYK